MVTSRPFKRATMPGGSCPGGACPSAALGVPSFEGAWSPAPATGGAPAGGAGASAAGGADGFFSCADRLERPGVKNGRTTDTIAAPRQEILISPSLSLLFAPFAFLRDHFRGGLGFRPHEAEQHLARTVAQPSLPCPD